MGIQTIRQREVSLNPVALLELCGFAASAVGITFALRTRPIISHDSRITLFALLVTTTIVHAFDLAEWTGHQAADRYGDILKVIMPVVWLFFLFVATRDGLLGKLHEKGQQLDFFLYQAPMAIAIVDERQRYIDCSRRWLEIHEMKTIPLGTPISEAPPRWGDRWAEVSRESLTAGITLDGLDHRTEDNSDVWYEWHVRPFEREGRRSGCLLIIEPATERIKEENQRQEAHDQVCRQQSLELVGQIASGVAHDLNNVMQVIQAHASILESERIDEPTLKEAAESIREAVDSASGMTKWLVSFGRKKEPELIWLDLRGVVIRMCDLLARALPRDQHLTCDTPDEPIRVWADPTLVEQLLINLVLNARDAMPQGGQIRVSLKAPQDSPILEVADEGTGIEEEVRSKILEPLFTTKGKQGSGLGLVVVQRAAEVHRAKLGLNTQVGVGSSFSVAFPNPKEWSPQATNGTTTSEIPWSHARGHHKAASSDGRQ